MANQNHGQGNKGDKATKGDKNESRTDGTTGKQDPSRNDDGNEGRGTQDAKGGNKDDSGVSSR